MVGEASGRMQKADCRDEIALPAAMLAWLKCGKQRTRNSRKRFLVFFCSLFVKARVVYRLLFSVALFFSLEDDEDAFSSPPTELPITPSTNITINTINQGFLYSGLGQFTRNYTQTVKRAADNKRRYAPGEGSIPPVLLSGVSKGVPPLAHDFACKV